MSSPLDSRANRSAKPGHDAEKTMNETSGRKQLASLAKYDHHTRSWKTSQTSFVPGISELSSETWPTSGSMRSGVCYRQPDVEPRRGGRAFGLLPTLTRGDASGARNGTAKGRSPKDGLTVTDWLWLNVGRGMLHPESAEWIMLWPTGWTALEPLEMDKFRLWLSEHGGS